MSPHVHPWHRRRPGLSLVELLLFVGILAIMGTTVVSVFIATQDARIRQQGIAALEQRSGQLLQTLTRRIRRAEKILLPANGETGPILVLQMTQENEFPTIIAQSSTTLTIVEKAVQSDILPSQVQIANLTFKNISDMNVLISFDLSTTIALPRATTYSRHFESAITLFTVDQAIQGGCSSSCGLPTCTASNLNWNVCESGVCTPAGGTIAC